MFVYYVMLIIYVVSRGILEKKFGLKIKFSCMIIIY